MCTDFAAEVDRVVAVGDDHADQLVRLLARTVRIANDRAAELEADNARLTADRERLEGEVGRLRGRLEQATPGRRTPRRRRSPLRGVTSSPPRRSRIWAN